MLSHSEVKRRYKEECRAINTLFLKTIENCFVRFAWVIIFAIACFLLYEQGQKQYKRDYETLSLRFNRLLEEKKALEVLRERLILRVNSQSDPALIELTLMKGLGLVPEGYKKVYFKERPITIN